MLILQSDYISINIINRLCKTTRCSSIVGIVFAHCIAHWARRHINAFSDCLALKVVAMGVVVCLSARTLGDLSSRVIISQFLFISSVYRHSRLFRQLSHLNYPSSIPFSWLLFYCTTIIISSTAIGCWLVK